MFKNATIFKFGKTDPGIDTRACLQAMPFVPCSGTQDFSIGFVPPRGDEHADVLESFGLHSIAKVMIETKSVPASEVQKKADAAADHIEKTTSRKPGKKEMRELKDDAYQALVPDAFPRQRAVWVWFDLKRHLLVIDAASNSVTDSVVTLLVKAIDGLVVSHLQTHTTPQSAMAQWLLATEPDSLPDGIALRRECELKSADEERSVIRFQRHNLQNAEVRKHVAEGKLPTRLALEWEGRVTFMLDEAMRLRKISFLEAVFDDAGKSNADGFDGDVAIFTGEMEKVIPGLVAALGGEMVKQEGGAA